MRHIRRSRSALAVLLVPLLALAAALAGCRKPYGERPSSAGASTSSSASSQQGSAPVSEAQRTRAMDQKAKDLDQQARDIQTMQGTEQEKIDAVNKFEQQRQDLNRQSEGPPASDGAQSAPPPPPLP